MAKGLEVGKWYSIKGRKCGLFAGKRIFFCFNGNEMTNQYGFDFFGNWSARLYIYRGGIENYQLVKEEEIQRLLWAEAVSRGFGVGAKFESLSGESDKINEITNIGDIYVYTNMISLKHVWPHHDITIYKNGDWAEIIKEEAPASTQTDFKTIASNLASLLEYKNKKYGDSALNPINIFAGKSKVGQRLDDKISRIQISTELQKNDVCDLIGYLFLVCKENDWSNFDEFKD